MKKHNQKKKIRTGRKILMAVAGITATGGYVMDMNKTHLFNPDWPPHAKFHDAWSISLGTFLGLSGIYFLSRRQGNHKENIRLGAMLPSFFWAAQGISFAFPGAKGLEAEFPQLIPRIKGVWINEKFGALLMLSLSGVGYILEQRNPGIEITGSSQI